MNYKKNLSLFYLKLAQLLQAGLPLDQALICLLDQALFFDRKILLKIRTEIQKGSRLSDACSLYPRYFNTLHCEMMRMGEASGQMIQTLFLLSEWNQQRFQFQQDCHQALFYPFFIFIAAILLCVFLNQVMLPSLSQLYEQLHQALPENTQALMRMSNTFKQYGALILIGVIVGVIALYIMIHFSRLAQKILHHFLFYCPLLHSIQKMILAYQVSAQLPLLLKHLSLLPALSLIQNGQKNCIIQDKIELIKDLLNSGTTFSTAAQTAACFPSMLIAFIQHGERTDALPSTLALGQAYYHTLLQAYSQRFIQSIQPLSLVLMSVFIGGIAYVFYEPLLTLQMF